MFVGFDDETKAYRLYDRTRKKVIISRDVIFDEGKIGCRYLDQSEPETLEIISTSTQDNSDQQDTVPDFQELETEQEIESLDVPDQVNSPVTETNNTGHMETIDTNLRQEPETRGSSQKVNHPLPIDRHAGLAERRYPTRNRAPSSRMRDYWALFSELMEKPLDFRIASQKKEWKTTIQSEINSILKNKTWEVINKCKAKLVARGFQ